MVYEIFWSFYVFYSRDCEVRHESFFFWKFFGKCFVNFFLQFIDLPACDFQPDNSRLFFI